MKKIITLHLLLLVTSMQIFAGGQKRKVLVIGIDGTRADALVQANTPNLDSLVAKGLSTFDAWHIDITVSGPSWSSIMCGVYHNKHGVTGNSYSNSNYNTYPYFPTRAKELKPNLKCIQYTEWAPMSDNVYNDGWDLKLKGPDGATTTTGTAAVAQIQDPDVDVLFTYFDAVDLTGHSSGFNPNNAAYILAIEGVDTEIGKMMTALRARPTYDQEDWLILVTTDHGGIGTGHGGNTITERRIWWIGASDRATVSSIPAKADPGSYNKTPFNVDTAIQHQSPVQADIAATAIHHLAYSPTFRPENQAAWALDGRSWLCEMGLCNEKLVGIKENTLDENQISVYPNPTSGKFNISVSSDLNVQSISVRVLDQMGRIVFEGENLSKNSSFDLSNNQRGIYFMEVKTQNKVTVKKIVVN